MPGDELGQPRRIRLAWLQQIALSRSLQLYGTEHFQAADRGVRIIQHRAQQALETAADGVGSRLGKAATQVHELHREGVIQMHGQVHRVVGDVAIIDLAKLQRTAAVALQALTHRVVFKDQDAVEQRLPRTTRPALHVGKRSMFVIAQLQVVALQLLQPITDLLRRLRRLHHRQGVDEQAQHLVGTRQRGRAAGHGRAEADRLLAGIALQQQQPSRLHERIGRHAQTLGTFTQVLGALGIPMQVERGMPCQLARGLRCDVVRQQGRAFERAKLAAPERLQLCLGLSIEPTDVIAEPSFRAVESLAMVSLEHLSQQPGVTPAVHQNVVAGPDQLHAMVVQAHQDDPHQGRQHHVERFTRLCGGQGLQGLLRDSAVAPVQHADGQVQMTMNNLQWLRQVCRRPEAGTQNIVTRDHEIPRLDEPFDHQAFHSHRRLVDVDPPFRSLRAVEQHALLHGRQRVDVADLQGRDWQAVQLRLGQAGQWEVGRCDASMVLLATVSHQCSQLLGIGICQPTDGRAFEQLRTERPGQLQFTAVHLPVHGQQATQRGARVVACPAVLLGRYKQPCLLIETGVELAQVVEHDLALRQRSQRHSSLSTTQVAQQAIAQPLARHGSQLFFDGFDRASQIGLRAELDGVHAGEPAHRTAQVYVIEQVFTAMTFQAHQYVTTLGPAADYACQGG
ncbi:hypothetical protein D3C81_634900 [compost metagenome]